MKVATIDSHCECQAHLGADLDENKQVIRAWAVEMRHRAKELAPAHTIGGDKERFQVGWNCPVCIRNTLRSFDTGGLVWTERAG